MASPSDEDLKRQIRSVCPYPSHTKTPTYKLQDMREAEDILEYLHTQAMSGAEPRSLSDAPKFVGHLDDMDLPQGVPPMISSTDSLTRHRLRVDCMLRSLFSEIDLLAITRSLALRTPPIISPGHPELTMDTAHSLFPDPLGVSPCHPSVRQT